MRLAFTILPLLMLAGCLDVPDEATTAAVPDVVVAPFAAEGEVFLAPTQSEERTETLLPFPVNATGSALSVDLALGSRYGPVELPPVLTDVLVELRAPDGTVLAEGSLTMDAPEAHLEAEATQTGEHVLALLSYGGSDEEANGDHVAWKITVVPN